MTVIDRSGLSPLRLGLVGVGLGALFVGTSAGALGPLTGAIETGVELAGTDYVLAAGLGVLAVVLGGAAIASGRGANMEQTTMPSVERPIPVPSAGEPFDRTVSSHTFVAPVVGRRERSAVRERLRTAAIAVVAGDEGCLREEARRQVDRSAWTDDRDATAFLAGERAGVGTWFVAATHGQTAPQYRANRTVDAIVDRHDGGRPGEGPDG